MKKVTYWPRPFGTVDDAARELFRESLHPLVGINTIMRKGMLNSSGWFPTKKPARSLEKIKILLQEKSAAF